MVKNLIISLLITILVGSMLVSFYENSIQATNVSSEKTIQNDILKELSNFNTDFSFAYKGDFVILKTAILNVMDSIRKEKPYIYEHVSKWQMTMNYKGNQGTLSFKINYLTDKQKEVYVSAEVKKISRKIVSKNATEFDKVKAVHDYIVLNSSYSKNTINSQYSAYTLLTEKKGVCQAYALLMVKMLQELKFDVKYVKGYSNNELHAWALVKVDGEWYHIDPTWNDPIGSKSDEVWYKFFMLTDKLISNTHSWETSEYPVAKSEKYKSFQVATQAYTLDNQLFYVNEKDKKYYQMDLKTLKNTAITQRQFTENKKSFVLND